MKPETLELLEESLGITLHDVGMKGISEYHSLDQELQQQLTRNFIKLKGLNGREPLSVRHLTEGFISRIYKRLLKGETNKKK